MTIDNLATQRIVFLCVFLDGESVSKKHISETRWTSFFFLF